MSDRVPTSRPTREQRPARSAGARSDAPAVPPLSVGMPGGSERVSRRPIRAAAAAASAPSAPAGATPAVPVAAAASAGRASRAAVAAATPTSALAGGAVAADKPADFMVTVDALTALLTAENESLRRHELAPVRDNIPQKQQLTRAYMEQMIAFHKNPGMLKSLSAERRQSMKEAMQILEPMIAENGRMLKAKIDSINRFMGVVVDAVKEQSVKEAVIYGGQGAMDQSLVDHKKMAVAVNREL